MKPYCFRCFTQDPYPAQADTGDVIYWFRLFGEDDDELCTIGLDTEGDVAPMFMGVADKDFDYDESYKILCPDCAALEAEQEESLYEDEDWDADDEDEYLI
ncbi:MAG: hypothetical protein GF334_05195 [Candidatus Altiarchaeales archaeon]|nr:hypothetical protein [Candidatus Altiarchaeales archaeon]